MSNSNSVSTRGFSVYGFFHTSLHLIQPTSFPHLPMESFESIQLSFHKNNTFISSQLVFHGLYNIP